MEKKTITFEVYNFDEFVVKITKEEITQIGVYKIKHTVIRGESIKTSYLVFSRKDGIGFSRIKEGSSDYIVYSPEKDSVCILDISGMQDLGLAD